MGEKENKSKAKRGRKPSGGRGSRASARYPTHVKPYLELIKQWIMNGITDKDIASNLGIAYSTLRKYRDKYPELKEAMTETKDLADAKVVNAFYDRAIGASQVEEIFERQIVGYKEEGEERVPIYDMVCIKKIVKQLPPDSNSAYKWLLNRRPEDWREKQTITHDVHDYGAIENLNNMYKEASKTPNDREIADLSNFKERDD